MTSIYTIEFRLESDATFGRGDGVAGLVDQEVEHDSMGLPYLRGRTLKGLLREESVNILFALAHMAGRDQAGNERWQAADRRLFGIPGSASDDDAMVRFGDAQLPDDLRQAIDYELYRRRDPRSPRLREAGVLGGLTAIRRQTAMTETGVPEEGSLRAMRVILRGTLFTARLEFQQVPKTEDLAWLAACVKAFRRAGTGRNRGRGRLSALLCDASGQDVTATCLKAFEEDMRS